MGDKLEGFRNEKGKDQFRDAVKRQEKRIGKSKIKPQEYDKELHEKKLKEANKAKEERAIKKYENRISDSNVTNKEPAKTGFRKKWLNRLRILKKGIIGFAAFEAVEAVAENIEKNEPLERILQAAHLNNPDELPKPPSLRDVANDHFLNTNKPEGNIALDRIQDVIENTDQFRKSELEENKPVNIERVMEILETDNHKRANWIYPNEPAKEIEINIPDLSMDSDGSDGGADGGGDGGE